MDRHKICGFHWRCLCQIANLNMWDIRNERIDREMLMSKLLNILDVDSILELRKSKWLFKLGNMDSIDPPRQLIGAWHCNKRAGHRPKKTTRNSYNDTLKVLGYSSKVGIFKEWMGCTRHFGYKSI